MAVLDRIAAKGLRYTNFHSAALCSPTLDRDSLQNCAAPVGSSLKGAIVSRLIVLFEQQRADETHDGVFVGEDADDVGAPLDLALERVDGVDFRLVILREGHEGQDISLGFIPERGKLWHLGTQPRGRLFLVERAGGRRAAEGVCEASKRSGRADDWQHRLRGRSIKKTTRRGGWFLPLPVS